MWRVITSSSLNVGSTQVSRISSSSTPPVADRVSRLPAETSSPADSDKNIVALIASTTRQNSPALMPPDNSGRASIGKTASKAHNA